MHDFAVLLLLRSNQDEELHNIASTNSVLIVGHYKILLLLTFAHQPLCLYIITSNYTSNVKNTFNLDRHQT